MFKDSGKLNEMENEGIQKQIKGMSDKQLVYTSLESLQKLTNCVETLGKPHSSTIGAATLILNELLLRFGEKITVK